MRARSKDLQRLTRRLARTRRDLRRALKAASSPQAGVSPLVPAGGFPDLPVVSGVSFATAAAGVKYAGRDDVMLAILAPGTAIAGVTTRSATRAAPVLDCEEKLAAQADTDAGAAIVVNSGNANAFTGANGRLSVDAVTGAAAKATGAPQTRVFSSSTGVIGEPLPHGRIVEVLRELAASAAPTAIEAAASAIMTTDTFAKGSGATVTLEGAQIAISGIAKGSGMIAPDMATMLVYIFTDARISANRLQVLLSRLNARTFNCITVDSDTSTSDTLLLAATGQRGPQIESDSAEEGLFVDALEAVMRDLAQQVVRDGEGASKFLEVVVTGAKDDAEAHTAALAIANSPLVKTAIAGEDANWGRVVMAVGKSGAAADRDSLSIWFGPHLVAEKGWVAQSYTEEIGAAYMTRDNLQLKVDLGIGQGQAVVWTCDLTHGYITINADYRS